MPESETCKSSTKNEQHVVTKLMLFNNIQPSSTGVNNPCTGWLLLMRHVTSHAVLISEDLIKEIKIYNSSLLSIIIKT